MKVNLYVGAILTPANQIYDSMTKGIIDIGWVATGYTPEGFPMLEALELPYGTKNAVNATRMANDFYRQFKPKQLDNVKLLFFTISEAAAIHSKKPIRTLNDVKGLKIRVAAGLAVDQVKALGGVPLVMPLGDTYDALRKGVADAVISATDSLKTSKFAEVTQYTTNNHESATTTCGFVGMNKAKWESLPKDIQDIIDKLDEEYIPKAGKAWDKGFAEGMQYGRTQGHQFITLTPVEEKPWVEAGAKPLIDKYIKEKSAMGLPAKEAVKWCLDWIKKEREIVGIYVPGKC